MHIEVCLPRSSLRAWHLSLAERLATRADTRLSVRFADVSPIPVPSCVDALFALERLLNGLQEHGWREVPASAFARHESASVPLPDLSIDIAGDTASTGPAWALRFDGQAGDVAAVASLLEGRMPVVSLSDTRTGRVIAAGRPGSESPGVSAGAIEDVLARTISLVGAALDGATPPCPAEPSPPAISCRAVSERMAKTLARAALRSIYRLLYHAPHWRVGWRRIEGPGVIDRGTLDGEPWRDLPDDGRRFYADPFPIVVGGRAFLFVEEFAHRLGRGVISAVEFGPGGPVGAPRPVLERDVHLSYPFVFAHAGEIWMVPESWQSGNVDLYRATSFPGGWVKEATLVAGIEASDATLIEREGRWWMFATVRDGAGCFSDALHLWSAPNLLGPWEPHSGNPVLVDVAAARPAGRVVERAGRLIRPVQDCRDGYGAALALAEIDRLDAVGFSQHVTATIRPGAHWPGRRLHTLNRTDNLEFIDGSRLARRLVPGPQPFAIRNASSAPSRL